MVELLREGFGEGFDGFSGGILFDSGEVCEEFVVGLIVVVVGVAV